MLRYGDNGPEVKDFQDDLEFLGYDLPKYGPDGWYGDETDEAASEFAQDHRLTKSYQLASPHVVSMAAAMAKQLAEMGPPTCFVDTRNAHPARKRGKRRSWESIEGITLHQTACRFLRQDETDPQKIAKVVARVSKIGVHHVVLRNGMSVWSNPYDHRMPQAQRYFNRTDVGIEIDGYYAGVQGDLSTFWKPKSKPNRKPLPLSPKQVDATLETVAYIIDTVHKHGGEIKYIHAHRQTSGTRVADPGELLWKAVAVPVMQEYGLSYGGPAFYVPAKKDAVEPGVYTSSYATAGRPIPREWDDSATHGYRDTPDKPTPQV